MTMITVPTKLDDLRARIEVLERRAGLTMQKELYAAKELAEMDAEEVPQYWPDRALNAEVEAKRMEGERDAARKQVAKLTDELENLREDYRALEKRNSACVQAHGKLRDRLYALWQEC